jgi:NitT/TauT family transport system ATP-binding protein
MSEVITRPYVAAVAPALPIKLAVEGVSKTFRLGREPDGKQKLLPVLRNVAFDVRESEIVSIIGESGSGKTTLLRIIQGLLRADRGQVLVDGKPVRGPGYDRGIVFQQANLLPWRNALANVEFGLELKGVDRSERRRRAMEYLDLVGLSEFAEQYPHQLSGGMQQRIGLARALAIDPQILLMDEPFSALDAQTRETLQRELLRIQSVTRKTILFVTHDLDEAVFLSDRIVVVGARSTGVKDVLDVPLARPRKDLPLLRGDDAFVALRDRIWNCIRPGGEQR